MARCGCKGKLLEWLRMCVACAAIASACVRVDVLRAGLPRGAVACEVPARQGQLRWLQAQWHHNARKFMQCLHELNYEIQS